MPKIVFVITLVILIVSCSPTPISTTATAEAQSTPTLPIPTTVPTITLVPTATAPPTPTFTPSPVPTEREITLMRHEEERVQYLAEQGSAIQIPVLEYHGDNYYFEYSNGAVVELNPAGFESQMKWFHENRVHAVTVPELNDWMQGKIELPARSVVLTFDIGNGSISAINRIIPVFANYQMFGIFTIFVDGMSAEESSKCVNDICWQTYRDAYLSGYVDIGSHTVHHLDFATLSQEEGLAELITSKNIIEENIGNGCVVTTLTWPFESVPEWGPNISSIGFLTAFGGNTYPILENTIWRDKPEDYYKLPRILPPGSHGISGRPNNKTLLQIMQMYTLANSNSGGWK
jgi:peptidoglycan/xylan/chitin deacetylase (PgdA/CDA1 family)